MTITYEAQVNTAVTLLMRMLPEILNGMTIEASTLIQSTTAQWAKLKSAA